MTDREIEPDGGATEDLEREELYAIVRTAVKDALLDVLGTVVLLGFALVFVFGGATTFVNTPDALGAAAGAVFVLGGFALAAYALDLLPSGQR